LKGFDLELEMNSIDVTMTATRRPDLVARTLRSFSEKFFSRLPGRVFFLNLDPLWGRAEDDGQIEDIGRQYFRDVRVRRPETPSFGDAVKWLWSQPETEWFLHLEDDWILSRPIDADALLAQASDRNLAQVRLHNWTRLQRRRKTVTLTTSPAFVRTEFAHLAASLMDGSLDPEKQFRNGTNPALQAAVAHYSVRHYGGRFTPQMAQDIGRGWRDEKKIKKAIVNGTSIWSSASTRGGGG
jgi:hypothetical protein